eukprot:ANDGO_02058.mRNA.1 hypothetical protein
MRGNIVKVCCIKAQRFTFASTFMTYACAIILAILALNGGSWFVYSCTAQSTTLMSVVDVSVSSYKVIGATIVPGATPPFVYSTSFVRSCSNLGSSHSAISDFCHKLIESSPRPFYVLTALSILLVCPVIIFSLLRMSTDDAYTSVPLPPFALKAVWVFFAWVSMILFAAGVFSYSASAPSVSDFKGIAPFYAPMAALAVDGAHYDWNSSDSLAAALLAIVFWFLANVQFTAATWAVGREVSEQGFISRSASTPGKKNKELSETVPLTGSRSKTSNASNMI